MKKLYILALSVLFGTSAFAQEVPAIVDSYDAEAIATEDLNGTARYVGMGGAMEALGADISVMGTNPAGIGLFRSNQLSTSLSIVNQQDGKTFQDGRSTKLSFDQIGIVLSTRSGRTGYLNFGFNFHKSRNFNYVLSAVNALNGSAQNRQTLLKDMNGLLATDHGTPLAYSQLDDIYEGNMTVVDGVLYEYPGINYEFDRAHTGYIGEYDFNLSGNINNRVYLGLTVGVNGVHYNKYSEYFEVLNSPTVPEVLIRDNHKISGYGYNIKAGIIFRPLEESAFRIGAYFSTPTFYKLTTDNYTTIGYGTISQEVSAASEDFRFDTPWKFGISAGHTIANMLALGATYEYSDHSSCDLRTIDDTYYDWYNDSYSDESSSDVAMKRLTENTLKGVSTIKLGAELRADKSLSIRLGYNYVSPAYQKNAVRDQTIQSPGVYYASTTDYTNWKATNRITAGVGFTAGKCRLDLAYQYSQRSGEFFPFMPYYSASYDEYDDEGNTTGNIVTLVNQCQPVKVKDCRHQLLGTFSISF